MDDETLRLIITASAGVVGALLGSGLTGWINSRNAKASREADRAMWELRSEYEKAEARRVEKRDLYLSFNTAKQQLTKHIIDAHFSQHPLDEIRCMEARREMSTAAFAVMMLPDTDLVTLALNDVMSSQGELLGLVEEALNEKRTIDEEKFQAASTDFAVKSAHALACMKGSLSGKNDIIEKVLQGPGELDLTWKALKHPDLLQSNVKGRQTES